MVFNIHLLSSLKTIFLNHYKLINAPIAQLDRASDYGSEGWGFNSSWAYFVLSQILHYDRNSKKVILTIIFLFSEYNV